MSGHHPRLSEGKVLSDYHLVKNLSPTEQDIYDIRASNSAI